MNGKRKPAGLRATWPRVLIALLSLGAGLGAAHAAPTLEAEVHPNHFIVVVDATESTVEGKQKRLAYQKALKYTLLERLYRTGFGPHIPPYRPARGDLLSVYHCGVLQGKASVARGRLKKVNYEKHVPHRLYERNSSVSEAALRAVIFPKQTYNYPTIAWHKPLALLRAARVSRQGRTQRTFVVFTTDGHQFRSTDGELQELRVAAAAPYEAAAKAIKRLNDELRYTDGNEGDDQAWIDTAASRKGVYLEAQEVLPKDWRSRPLAPTQSPIRSVKAGWEADATDEPRAYVKLELDPHYWQSLGMRTEADPTVRVSVGGATADASWSDGSELKLFLPVAKTATGPELRGTVELTAHTSQNDPRLGTRHLRFADSAEVELPPAPPPPAVSRLPLLAALMAAGLGLLGIAWLTARHLLFSGFQVDLPGPGMVRLPRRGEAVHPLTCAPMQDTCALWLLLPPPWAQRWFFRDYLVRLEVDQGGVVTWTGPFQPGEPLRLPQQEREWRAGWNAVPSGPGQMRVILERGNHRSVLACGFSGVVGTQGGGMHKEWRHQVGLDLGSESMAAYYRCLEPNHPWEGLVDLQDLADKIVVSQAHPNPPASRTAKKLYEPDGSASRRLRTRIEVQNGVVDIDVVDPIRKIGRLPASHAALDLQQPGAGKSLFRIFFGANEEPLRSLSLMPNPKIPFQDGGKDVLPMVFGEGKTDADAVHIEPADLLCHLVTQVIHNLVLGSPQLKHVERQDIQLTLTIPSVYSLSHRQTLHRFVQQHLQLGEVKVIYESDAVAYYALGTEGRNRATREFYNRIRQRATHSAHLLTIDVGRGTTDLTLLKIVRGEAGKGSDDQTILARTGKSDGGNRASFILAEHYDRQIKRVFREIGSNAPKEPPFSLCYLEAGARRPVGGQILARADMENLVETVKRAITTNGTVTLPHDEQADLIEPVVEILVAALNTALWPPQEVADLKQALVQALLLPTAPAASPSLFAGFMEALRKGRLADWLTGVFTAFLKRKGLTPQPTPTGWMPGAEELAPLRAAIQEYVRENSEALIEQLLCMGLCPEESQPNKDLFKKKLSEAGTPTFVVIAGQASQFPPLRKAILDSLQRYVPADNVLELRGAVLKNCCCAGAVFYQDHRHNERNPNQIHGSYVFVRPSAPLGKPPITRVSMSRLNDIQTFPGCAPGGEGRVTVEFGDTVRKHLFFSTRTFFTDDTAPALHDGWSAFLGSFERERLTLSYRPGDPNSRTEPRLCIIDPATGIPETDIRIETYGGVNRAKAPRVWPDVFIDPSKEMAQNDD